MDGGTPRPEVTDGDPPPVLLLVDGHNLLWIGTFGFANPILSRDGTRVLTGTFAFFALLRAAIRDNFAETVEPVVVFDGPNGGAARKAVHTGYKASRSSDDALEPLRHLPDVKRGLDLAGVPWVEIADREADDVIATIARRCPDRHVVIMSRDRDYYQLIDERVSVLNTRFPAGERFITPEAVRRLHGVTPAQWVDFRALSGDPADEIPGVTGIGPKTAAALLDGGLTIEDLPSSGRLASGRARAVANEYDLALKWRGLIALDTDVPVAFAPTGSAAPPLPAPGHIIDDLGLW